MWRMEEVESPETSPVECGGWKRLRVQRQVQWDVEDGRG
jgi:hypothetical protein